MRKARQYGILQAQKRASVTEKEKTNVLKQFEKMIWHQVYRVNRNKFLSNEDCEELANTFRFKVWTSLDKYDGRTAVSTWVQHTLNLAGASFFYHYFKDTVKKIDNQAIPFSRILRSGSGEESEDDGKGKRGAVFSCIDSGFSEIEFQSVIDSLPNKRYARMLLDRMNGMTYREIGEKWGLSHQAIRQYMQSQAKKVEQYV